VKHEEMSEAKSDANLNWFHLLAHSEFHQHFISASSAVTSILQHRSLLSLLHSTLIFSAPPTNGVGWNRNQHVRASSIQPWLRLRQVRYKRTYAIGPGQPS
jgi:hypothetical protein